MMSKNKKVLSTAIANRLILDTESFAWKVFQAFVKGDKIDATEDELLSYATDELELDLSNYSPVIVENMPLVLVAFMNMWSGWHFRGEFLAGKFKKDHYFQRFHKYMVHKMNSLGRNVSLKQTPEYKVSALNESSGSQTSQDDTEPKFSPYSILIQCPPHMLNTIVFSNKGDDVIMKQHLGTTWLDLSTTQLLNWPHVEVRFKTKDICFVRRSAIEFVRYLNFLPHECQKNKENTIEHVETLRTGRPQHCFSLRLLEAYIREYLDALKSINNITAETLEEIESILLQFLEDVKFMKVNRSIATDTVVLFRLCPVPFIRNKKLLKNTEGGSEEARVGYCEIITPKIELLLMYFRAVQKEASYVCFEYPDKIKESADSNEIGSPLPNITYKCTYCKEEFLSVNSKKMMMDHLKKEHKTEQHVRCTVCKKQFDVLNLAACRWRHKCVPSSNPMATIDLS